MEEINYVGIDGSSKKDDTKTHDDEKATLKVRFSPLLHNFILSALDARAYLSAYFVLKREARAVFVVMRRGAREFCSNFCVSLSSVTNSCETTR